jgi:hypothetical protein
MSGIRTSSCSWVMQAFERPADKSPGQGDASNHQSR